MMGMGMAQTKPQGPLNSWSTAHPQVYERIEAALAKSTSVDFHELPLEDAVRELQATHDIPILIEGIALEELGLAPDLPVTLSLANVSVSSALNMILDDVDLTYTIDNEMLCITTTEYDEKKHQLLRVYWSSQSGLQADEGSSELIQTMVEPESWTALGGKGDISILGAKDDEHSGLAIRATYRTHRKIEQFLESIRSGTSQAVSGVPSSVTGMSGLGGTAGSLSGSIGTLGRSGGGVESARAGQQKTSAGGGRGNPLQPAGNTSSRSRGR
jgi:hypothetical protein